MRRNSGQEWVHIVGIGGAATSGLARLLDARGVRVTGSDLRPSPILDRLRRDGVRAFAPHGAENLDRGVTELVYSAAVPDDNPELEEARRRGLSAGKYAAFLGRIFGEKNGIAVAGTHGKTSTSGMLASIFLAAGRDPSVLIGGDHPSLDGNWRSGSGPDFIAEACEFDRSFHQLHPSSGVITNVELDHPDVYPDEDALLESLRVYVAGFQRGAHLITNGDSRLRRSLPVAAGLRRVTYGFGEDCRWRAERLAGGAAPRFLASCGGRLWGEVRLRVPGIHSIANALGALALAAEMGLPADAIREGREGFPGIVRRFQHLGAPGGVDLIDDYAHHPTEVDSTIATARELYPGRRVWAVFQPHQFARLRRFGTGFASSLAAADLVLLMPVYSVREAARSDAREVLGLLEAGVRQCGTPALHSDSLEEGIDLLDRELSGGDVCLAIGAGDISRLADGVRARLERRGAPA